MSYWNTGKVPLAEFAAWCVESDLKVPLAFSEFAAKASSGGLEGTRVGHYSNGAISAQSPSAETPKAAKGKNAAPLWQAEARRVADQLHLSDKKAGAHSSISNIADRVAEDLRARGIEGQRTPLSGNYILREALQSGRWKRPTE